jgi:FMN phosphatase YigB (HAD superfamily)
MENIKIRGVLFDFDDTLTNTSHNIKLARERVFTEMQRDYGIGREKYEKALSATSSQYDKIPFAQRTRELYYELMAAKSGIKFVNEDVKRYADLFDEGLVNDMEFALHMEEVITSLRRSGLKVGILTGAGIPDGVKTRRLKNLPVYKLLAVVIIAGETIPEAKTDRAAFTRAADICDLRPSEILFVGDRPDIDIDNSKAAGMSTVLFNAFRSYPKQLGKSKPDYVVNDLRKILDIVNATGKEHHVHRHLKRRDSKR